MKINKKELRIVLGSSIILALRMSGIFMMLPILTIYSLSLNAVSEHLIGVAIGIYGITQLIFQIPFGLMSDKIGYKPIIIVGLLLYTIGCEIAAITNNIWGLIIGRALQGSGAISGSLITLVLNSVDEQYKMKSMAIIGTSFGITFTLSIILSPIFTNKFGLHGLLQISAILGLIAIALTYIMIPYYPLNSFNPKNNINFLIILKSLKKILIHAELLKLNFITFFLHTILTLNFIIIPKIITNLGYMPNMHWKIYSIIMIISAFIILPYIFYTKNRIYINKALFFCTHTLFLSGLIMYMNIYNPVLFLFGIQLFFIAFNLMEFTLPILINKISPKEYKSTTISIYSISQFLGIGLGGFLGGLLLEIKGIKWVLLFSLIISTMPIIILKTKNNFNQ